MTLYLKTADGIIPVAAGGGSPVGAMAEFTTAFDLPSTDRERVPLDPAKLTTTSADHFAIVGTALQVKQAGWYRIDYHLFLSADTPSELVWLHSWLNIDSDSPVSAEAFSIATFLFWSMSGGSIVTYLDVDKLLSVDLRSGSDTSTCQVNGGSITVSRLSGSGQALEIPTLDYFDWQCPDSTVAPQDYLVPFPSGWDRFGVINVSGIGAPNNVLYIDEYGLGDWNGDTTIRVKAHSGHDSEPRAGWIRVWVGRPNA